MLVVPGCRLLVPEHPRGVGGILLGRYSSPNEDLGHGLQDSSQAARWDHSDLHPNLLVLPQSLELRGLGIPYAPQVLASQPPREMGPEVTTSGHKRLAVHNATIRLDARAKLNYVQFHDPAEHRWIGSSARACFVTYGAPWSSSGGYAHWRMTVVPGLWHVSWLTVAKWS